MKTHLPIFIAKLANKLKTQLTRRTTMKNVARILWALLLVSSNSYTQPQSVDSRISETLITADGDSAWVPEGFESLDEPQETLVDVFYGGYFLVSVPARFTPAFITFLQTEPVAELINDLNDPESFKQLLAIPLSTNASLVCRSKYSTDCGRMTTSNVGVIFDVSSLRVELFLGPDLLRTRSLDQINFLPPSDAGLSLLDDFALFGSGGTENSTAYNIANSTLLGYQENRVRLDSNYTDSDNFSIDALAFEREKNGLDYKAGIFRVNAGEFVFMQDQQFLGATFESSLVTRQDLEFSLGSTLAVFLDSRSLVQLFKDGRLVNSAYYDAGNQELNPRGLPSGSYELEIVITDSANRTRTETQFYSKSARIPPEDQPLYFIQAGEYAETVADQILPELQGEQFVRAGINKRLSQSLAGRMGVSVNSDSTMAEIGLYHQGVSYEVQATTAYDEYSTSALEFRGRYRYSLGEISAYTRRITAGDIPAGKESQLGTDTRQTNISSSFRTDYGTLGVFMNYIENEEEEENKSYGIRWSSANFLGLDNVGTSFELSNNNGSNLALIRLNYRTRQGAWSNSANAEYKREEISGRSNSNDINGNVSTTWQSDPGRPTSYQASVRADKQENSTIESGFEATSKHGRGSVTTKHNVDADSWEYTAAVRTSFAATTSSVGFGGKSRANSGFLVSVLSDEDSDIEVDVMVNGTRQATIRLNSEVFISATAYEVFELEFIPVGNSLATIQYKGRPLTLYPGNVISVEAKLQELVVAIGRIVDSSGNAISNALIRGIEGLALTDEYGYFQAEMSKGVQAITVAKSQNTCAVMLPEFAVDQKVVMLGSLSCNPL